MNEECKCKKCNLGFLLGLLIGLLFVFGLIWSPVCMGNPKVNTLECSNNDGVYPCNNLEDRLVVESSGVFEVESPRTLDVWGDGKKLITISMRDAKVTYEKGVTRDKASRAFWNGLAGFKDSVCREWVKERIE